MNAAPSLCGTVVFTDLVGFTEFNDACGDDAALEALDRMRAVMDASIGAAGAGRVVKELGDGLLVWFPVGAAPIDAMCRFLADVVSQREEGEFPLAVRVGGHHGEVRARGDDLVGMTVNVAARIVDLAGPMEMIVSEELVTACVDAAAAGDVVEPIGPTNVRGVSEPLWLYRVVAPATNFESIRARR